LIQNGRGIAGAFKRLLVEDSSILASHIHGASLLSCTNSAVTFANSYIGDCGQFGLRLESCSPSNKPIKLIINKTILTGNKSGGAVLIGPANVQVLASKFLNNGQVGFWCNDIGTTNNLFFNNLVSGNYQTQSMPGNGVVIANGGKLTTVVSDIIANQGAGFEAYNSGISLSGCCVTSNLYGGFLSYAEYQDTCCNTITNNTEENLYFYGNLPVPNSPIPTPDMPP